MQDGALTETEVGSPQGGVISPLLANIYLNEFDQKMKALNIRIVRYADGILIFSTLPRQAKRFQEIATDILEKDLALTVNTTKTHITRLKQGVSYLGPMYRWRSSISPPIHLALPNVWFEQKGLINLTKYEVGILSQFYELY